MLRDRELAIPSGMPRSIAAASDKVTSSRCLAVLRAISAATEATGVRVSGGRPTASRSNPAAASSTVCRSSTTRALARLIVPSSTADRRKTAGGWKPPVAGRAGQGDQFRQSSTASIAGGKTVDRPRARAAAVDRSARRSCTRRRRRGRPFRRPRGPAMPHATNVENLGHNAPTSAG